MKKSLKKYLHIIITFSLEVEERDYILDSRDSITHHIYLEYYYIYNIYGNN